MEWPDQSFDVLEESIVSAAESVEGLSGHVEVSTEQVKVLPASVELAVRSKIVYECDICWYTTYKKFNFERHHKSHIEKKDYDVNGNIPASSKSEPCTSTPSKELAKQNKKMCDQCGNYFKSSFGLKLHTKNRHDKVYKYTCSSCGKGYNQRVQYRCHLASHLSLSIEKCCFCNKPFKGHSSLARHKLICSLNPERNDTDENNTFDCDICCKNFKTKDRLNYHTKGKHGPKKYFCPQCGNAYSWRSSLKKHRLRCK